jgi:hypothetical protein
MAEGIPEGFRTLWGVVADLVEGSSGVVRRSNLSLA